MAKQCDVCFGTPGKYPVINRFGQQLYEIECPECYGLGQIEDDKELPSTSDARILSNWMSTKTFCDKCGAESAGRALLTLGASEPPKFPSRAPWKFDRDLCQKCFDNLCGELNGVFAAMAATR